MRSRERTNSAALEKYMMGSPSGRAKDYWIGMGIAIGAGMGMILGMMVGNMAMGIGIGVAMGIVVGAALQNGA